MNKQNQIKNSLIIYDSFYEVIKKQSNTNRLKLYDAIFKYGFEQEMPELPPRLQDYFKLMKPQFDANYRKWLAKVKATSRAEVMKELTQNSAKSDNFTLTPEMEVALNEEFDIVGVNPKDKDK